MSTFSERKQKLCGIIDGYTDLCDRLGGEYITRKKEILDLRKNTQKERYQIGLIGFVKRGKSTLLNALLGNKDDYNISPARLLPCTAAIVKYFDSALHPDGEGKEGAIVKYNDGRNPDYINKKDIPMYVDQHCTDEDGKKVFSEDRAKKIDCIEVYGKYKLIETRGVIVDTPGMGAVYDQDYLVDYILPEVDIILSPTAADNFKYKEEEDFIKYKLKESEQKKLMFLLTKIDSEKVKENNGLQEAYSYVQSFASSVLGGTPPVYKVAAKKVLEAYKEKKTPSEIEAVKEEWGLKELENELDKKLRNTSVAEENMRLACKVLEGYFRRDEKDWTKFKEEYSLDLETLVQNKKKLEEECEKRKRDFKKGVQELERNWNKEVNRFIRRLEDRDISDQLSNTLERENLFSLIGYQKKMERKIQSILQREMKRDLDELQAKLEKIVWDFNDKLNSDIENDSVHGSIKSTGSGGEINTLIGGGIAAAGGYWGVSTALGAVNVISAAAAESAVATGAAKASFGFFPWLGKALFGIGRTATTAGTAITAQSTLVTALIGGIVPIIGGIAVTTIAYRLGTNFAKGKFEKKIPEIVEKQLQEASASVEESSQKVLKNVLTDINDRLDTELTEKLAELDKIIEAVNDRKRAGAQKEIIERNLLVLDKLSKELILLSNAS